MVTVVFTPAYQVYLSRRCAFACDYCNFPHLPSPLPPSLKTFRTFLRTAQRLGAWQVDITSGEGTDHTREIESLMRYYGFSSWYDYIYELCRLTLEAKGRQPLSPVLDVGPLPTRELKKLAPVVPVIRLLLDSADPELSSTVHSQAPQKSPVLRTLALNDIGKAGIAISTGIRVGIGESPESWVEAVSTVNRVHERYGNVMSFHVVPFVPQQFSRMADNPPISNDLYRNAIRVVRQHLHQDISLVGEVFQRLALAPEAVISGAFDLGPIRIADNERFDVDMLNAVNGVRDLLTKIHVEMKCVPVVREEYKTNHHFPPLVEANLQRFKDIEAHDCIGPDDSTTDPSYKLARFS